MSIKTIALSLFVVSALAACSKPSDDLSNNPEATAEDVPSSVEAVIPTTPAMLAAALTGDPELMRDAARAEGGSCHAPSTCPGFASCGGWSQLNICNETCGSSCGLAKTTHQYSDSFRVCFNAAGASCTEWRQHHFSFCDC
jgi:hypothetical protein